jgi:hypothetical protein
MPTASQSIKTPLKANEFTPVLQVGGKQAVDSPVVEVLESHIAKPSHQQTREQSKEQHNTTNQTPPTVTSSRFVI